MNSPVGGMLLRSLGGLVVTLFLASILIFGAMYLAPGDPVATLAGGSRPTPELVAAIRAEHHLDDPVWKQYWLWLSGALTGNLGTSFVYGTPVTALVASRFGITLQLVVLTVIVIGVVGIGTGILAALAGRRTDRAVVVGTTLGMAMPTFVVAILLIWIFATTLGWFPVFGAGSGGFDRLWHLVLPALSLAVMYIAYISRITRSSLMNQRLSEHVETARVRGLPFGHTFRVHMFRNAAPQILSISGVTIAGLFAVSAIAEQAFGLGGIGSLFVEAAAREDLPVVQAISLILVTLFVVLNTVADLTSSIIDPALGKTRSFA